MIVIIIIVVVVTFCFSEPSTEHNIFYYIPAHYTLKVYLFVFYIIFYIFFDNVPTTTHTTSVWLCSCTGFYYFFR